MIDKAQLNRKKLRFKHKIYQNSNLKVMNNSHLNKRKI